MNIFGLTMLTNPEHRQDPWRASIAQALEIFDVVVVVCGWPTDEALIRSAFPDARRVRTLYLHWPQPEWSYEELPKHLNHGLVYARENGADWIVKFDIDCFFHERERLLIRATLEQANNRRKRAASFEKYQFFLVDRCYEKGKLPLALNLHFPILYGSDETRYTDLCQPIVPSGRFTDRPGTGQIPSGAPLTERDIVTTRAHVWNYDYTFKTEERAMELLYHFDRSHARWWGRGYGGRKLEEITPETAFQEYLGLLAGRVKKCVKKMPMHAHPKHVRALIDEIRPEQLGHSLWNKITL